MHIIVEELITRRRCEDESVVEILSRQTRREYVATIRGFVVVTDAAGLFSGFCHNRRMGIPVGRYPRSHR